MAKKIGVEAARRRALVEAAIAEVGAAGSVDVPVERIARRAGVSAALAHHYFGSKDRILFAAMRAILAEFARTARLRRAEARGPRARLEAVVETSFDESQTAPHVVSAWLVFYVQSLRSGPAARLLRIYRRRLRSTLLHDLRRLAPGAEAERIALTLGALIDGLYIRCAPAAEAPPVAETRAAILSYLDAALAPDDPGGTAFPTFASGRGLPHAT